MAWNSRNYKQIEELIENLGYTLLSTYFPKESGKDRKVVVRDETGYEYDVFLSNLQRQNLNIVDSRTPHHALKKYENMAIFK